MGEHTGVNSPRVDQRLYGCVESREECAKGSGVGWSWGEGILSPEQNRRCDIVIVRERGTKAGEVAEPGHRGSGECYSWSRET